MKDGERLARIEQKLTDFVAAHKVQHEAMDQDLTALKKIRNKIETPVKWVGWFVTLSTGGALAYFGEHVGKWILQHFRGQ